MSPQSVATEHAQRVLVFGAAGMLGRALIKLLRRGGFDVTGLSRNQCDITRVDSVVDRLRDFKPNILINCAAYTEVDRCEDQEDLANAVNGKAVGQLALLARVYDMKLVHFSTDAVFDGRAAVPYRPDDRVGPLSVYAKSKLIGEEAIQDINPKGWLLVRTAWLFGDGHCFPRTIIRRARADRSLRVVRDQVGSPTYANDLAEATTKLLTLGAEGIWHVVNSGSATWFEVACETLEVARLSVGILPVTTQEYAAANGKLAPRPEYSVLDNSAYAHKTGAAMRPWREALRAARDVIVGIPESESLD
jgi:dTDP-4-dehydrorhamnose reductase